MRVIIQLFNFKEKRVFLPNYSLNIFIMKKRDLLLAGLFLFSVSAFAQEEDEVLEPTRYKDDAKVIFEQRFEGSINWTTVKLSHQPKKNHEDFYGKFYTWQSAPIDSIEQVTYYKRAYDGKDTGNPGARTNIYSGEKQWEIAGVRDTLMYLYDGVMKTDAGFDDDSCLQWDSYSIVPHNGESREGDGIGGKDYGLESNWGEKGGAQFFRYISATSRGVNGRGGGTGGYNPSHDEKSTTQDHYVPEYRRNLFVRNLPIEDSASYRVTVFVKPTRYAKLQQGITPRIGLELMRGHFHSEKSFLVNNTGHDNTYDTFSDKTDYTNLNEGQWNKITLMAYYTNDSIGNAAPYLLSYYWADDWNWVAPFNPETGEVDLTSDTTTTFKFIQQPNKYFVRLSFRSDSTIFDVDNLSLTKSTIGGVEYSGTMIRVDFGYQTNLGKLAEAAKERNKIASVELPGEYFDVWGLYKDPEDPESEPFWENVPINSAEYQGDGFMYMWSKPWEEDNSPRIFDSYDSVLVSFTNPTDSAELTLKYTGSRFPNGGDPEWIADPEKRIVFDFHNEIGYKNPTILTSPVTKEAVRSLAELTPVLQEVPYGENDVFGLDPDTRSIEVKFSKNLSFDTGSEYNAKSKKTKAILRKGGHEEYWTIRNKYDDEKENKGWTIIERPASETDPLEGDYELVFEKITHLETPNPDIAGDYSKDVALHYHFGEFVDDATSASSSVVAFSNWRADINNYDDTNRPLPTSAYLQIGGPTAGDQFAFAKGTGVNTGAKCGFYPIVDDTITVLGTQIPDNGVFYLSNRKDKNVGHLYSIVNLNAGTYSISFKLAGQSGTDRPMALYFYAKPEGTLANGDANGFATLEAASKTVLEEGRKPKVDMGGTFNLSTKWKEDVEIVSYDFFVPAAGDYVFEWTATTSTNYQGIVISNYWITTSFGNVARVNDAIVAVETALENASATKYQGTAYNALNTVKDDAKAFIPAKKASMINKPSEYAAEVKVMEDAIKVLDTRKELVDKLQDAIDNAKPFLEMEGADKYVTEYDALEKAIAAAESFIESTIVNSDDAVVTEQTNALNEAKSALEIKINGAEALSARIKALDALANSVNADYGETAEDINERIAKIDFDDEELAQIMKSAIKIAIYDNIVNNNADPKNLDLTGFIRNFNLYATPKVIERTDIKADNSKAAEAAEGYNMQHLQHTWNNGDLNGKEPIWIMIQKQDYTDIYPGWTVRAETEGNRMVTLEPQDDKYKQLRAGVPLFDAQLAMDWGGKAELKGTVEDLPLGKYDLSVTLNQNTGSGTVLNATSLDILYEGSSSEVKDIMVYDGKIDIDFILTSGQGWSAADNFKLTFTGKDDLFDYAALLENAKSEFNNIMTVVDSAEVEGAEYEYYTLNWIKVENPVKNEVYFRKNGSVVEKVIFK